MSKHLFGHIMRRTCDGKYRGEKRWVLDHRQAVVYRNRMPRTKFDVELFEVWIKFP